MKRRTDEETKETKLRISEDWAEEMFSVESVPSNRGWKTVEDMVRDSGTGMNSRTMRDRLKKLVQLGKMERKQFLEENGIGAKRMLDFFRPASKRKEK